MSRKHVFGPILSRRLGVSLGVDLVTPRTCPQDCIYCEARATENLTAERKEYVPVAEVMQEIATVMQTIPSPDYITFSGSGEPTLNSRIGEVVNFIKTRYPQQKLCLLTNGVLLGDETLRRELFPVDLVIPSLDASNEAEYRLINRPVRTSLLTQLVEDIAGFSRIFPHRLVLEIFVIPGMNDSDASIARFAELVKYIAPAAVQLNTLDRPGVIKDLRAASPETLNRFIRAISPLCEVESVRPLPEKSGKTISTSWEEELLEIIRHRRLTVTELSKVTGVAESELMPQISRLCDRKLAEIDDAGFISGR